MQSITFRGAFPGCTRGKEPTCQCRRHEKPTTRWGFDLWVKKIPWRRAEQLTPVFLLGESHAQRSLWATVHGVAKSRTLRKQLSTHKMLREGFCQNDKKLKDTILEREREKKKPRSQEICIWNLLKFFVSSKPFMLMQKKTPRNPVGSYRCKVNGD